MKVISCFSYKGGAGRSTLALNTIPFLADKLNATKDNPLIVVDMDVDSCGLTYLFDLDKNGKIDEDYNVQRLFGEGGIIPRVGDTVVDHDLFRYMCPVGGVFNREPLSILCLPANPGAVLGSKGSNYDAPDDNVKDFVEECEECGCCGILFDSAVGDQLTARWSNKLSKYILCCMRPTQQFRDGTKRFFDKFDDMLRNKKIIVIPNVVPTDELTIVENNVKREYPYYAKAQIIEGFSKNISKKSNEYFMDLVEGDIFGIPKIDRFMWQEGILDNLAKSELNEYEKKANLQYEKIATMIAER